MATAASCRMIFGPEQLPYETKKNFPWHKSYPRDKRDKLAKIRHLTAAWASSTPTAIEEEGEEKDPKKPQGKRTGFGKLKAAMDAGAESEDAGAARRPSVSPMSFRQAASTIMQGRKMRDEITGRLKGRLLLFCDLPPNVTANLATQLGWNLSPLGSTDSVFGRVSAGAASGNRSRSRGGLRLSRRRTTQDAVIEGGPSSEAAFVSKMDPNGEEVEAGQRPKGVRLSYNMVESGRRKEEDDNTLSYYGSDYFDFKDEESLRSAFHGFTYRMAALREDEVDELTGELASGLKSLSSADSGGTDNRMAAVIARTQPAVDYRKEGGVNTASADDTLTKRAEEQASRLPEGDDSSVNLLPEENVKALFDTAHDVNLLAGGSASNSIRVTTPQSAMAGAVGSSGASGGALAEGLQSWANFGKSLMSGRQEESGGEIARVANEQMAKKKFQRHINSHKQKRSKKSDSAEGRERGSVSTAGAGAAATPLPGDAGSAAAPTSSLLSATERADRRGLYASGVWYLAPSRWNDRFESIAEERERLPTAVVEATLASTIPAHQRPLVSTIETSAVSDILMSSGSAGGVGGSSPGGAPGGRGKKATKHLALAQRKEEALARREEENKRLSQLESTRAFSEFLRERPNFEPPAFLKDLLT